MNLGIERSTLGDIAIIDNVGYIFASEDIADYIVSSLTKVKHTDMRLPHPKGQDEHRRRGVHLKRNEGKTSLFHQKATQKLYSKGFYIEVIPIPRGIPQNNRTK